MEKVSGIIPTSTRQTWVTGEVAKPRRVSEPPPEEISNSSSKASRPVSEFRPESPAENVGKTNMAFKGGKLSRMA